MCPLAVYRNEILRSRVTFCSGASTGFLRRFEATMCTNNEGAIVGRKAVTLHRLLKKSFDIVHCDERSGR